MSRSAANSRPLTRTLWRRAHDGAKGPVGGERPRIRSMWVEERDAPIAIRFRISNYVM